MYGLDTSRAKSILQQKLKEDADLFYYIDDIYIEKLFDLLIEGIAEIIEENNRKFISDFERDLKKAF